MQGTREEWQDAFLVAAIFSVVGGAIYLVLAKGEVQPWALHPDDHQREIKINSEKTPLLEESEKTVNNNLYTNNNYGSLVGKKPVVDV